MSVYKWLGAGAAVAGTAALLSLAPNSSPATVPVYVEGRWAKARLHFGEKGLSHYSVDFGEDSDVLSASSYPSGGEVPEVGRMLLKCTLGKRREDEQVALIDKRYGRWGFEAGYTGACNIPADVQKRADSIRDAVRAAVERPVPETTRR